MKIDITNLRVTYPNFQLNIPQLVLDRGVSALVGVNGAGKTTLINSILGEKKYTGSICHGGLDIFANRIEVLENIALVSDGLFYPQDVTGIQIMRFVRRYYPNWNQNLFEVYTEKYSLNLKLPIGKLSRGNRTRLDLALAFAKSTDCLILDEPTSGLDPAVRCEILKELKTKQVEREITVLFSTHILEDISLIADRVICIRNGCIVSDFLSSKVSKNMLSENIMQMIMGDANYIDEMTKMKTLDSWPK